MFGDEPGKYVNANIFSYRYSSLAQLAEHLTVNQVVAGSSPAGGAKTKKPDPVSGFLFCFPLLVQANYTKEKKRQFEEYTDLYCECSSILQETAFTYGMRLGIKILLDALTNN